MKSRKEIVQLAKSWLGKKESDGSYKFIIDTYNEKAKPLPRSVKMEYGWAWCACTWSALVLTMGYQDICPVEISCGEILKQAKANSIWKSREIYTPKMGDAVLYDMRQNDNYPDHIGIVEYVNENEGYMTVIEGNYSKSVKRRTILLNDNYILGYVTPKYDEEDTEMPSVEPNSKNIVDVAEEVIIGKWGSGEKRKQLLEANGYNYREVQDMVNSLLNSSAAKATNTDQSKDQPTCGVVKASCSAKSRNKAFSGIYKTTEDLYCRNDAGSNKQALCIIPKGTEVENYGYYTRFNDINWLYIRVILDGIAYTGFSSSKYLRRAE